MLSILLKKVKGRAIKHFKGTPSSTNKSEKNPHKSLQYTGTASSSCPFVHKSVRKKRKLFSPENNWHTLTTMQQVELQTRARVKNAIICAEHTARHHSIHLQFIHLSVNNPPNTASIKLCRGNYWLQRDKKAMPIHRVKTINGKEHALTDGLKCKFKKGTK